MKGHIVFEDCTKSIAVQVVAGKVAGKTGKDIGCSEDLITKRPPMSQNASENVPEFAVGFLRFPHLFELGDTVITAKTVFNGRINDAEDVWHIASIYGAK